MDVRDDHPLLLRNYEGAEKAQDSTDAWRSASVQPFDTRQSGKQPHFDYDEAVRQFRSWIYAAIMLNANAVAQQPLRLYVRKRPGDRSVFRTSPVPPKRRQYLKGLLPAGGPHRDTVRKLREFGEDYEEVTESHPVLEVLRLVNPWFNGFDLIQLLVIYLEATGNAYWHPVFGAGGIPETIWPMPSQWVRVIPDEDEFVRGYRYGSGLGATEFPSDEVIHFRTASPSDEGIYYGLGKIEAGWGVVALNHHHHAMDLAFAQNHARPDYLAVVKSGADDPALDRFEAQVERKLRRMDAKAGRFVTISGDVDLKPLNFPPKDLAGRDEVVEEVAAVMGTPVSLLKANDPNLASAQVGYASWKAGAVLTLMRLIEQKLNQSLLPLFGIEGDACLAFDNPVPEDRAFQLQESTALVASAIRTINEDREIRGEPPAPGGDVLRFNGLSLERLDEPQPSFGVPGFSARPQAAARPIAAVETPGPALLNSYGQWPKRLSDLVWKVDADQDVRDGEPEGPRIEFARALAAIFSSQRDQIEVVLARSSPPRGLGTGLVDWIDGRRAKATPGDIERIRQILEDSAPEIAEQILPLLERMIAEGGEKALADLGLDTGFDVTNPLVAELVRDYSLRLSGAVTDSTVRSIQRVLEAGITAGASNQEIADAIQETGSLDAQRAQAISRTESARAYSRGQEAGWEQSGVVAGKKWLLAPRACEFCRAAAAELNKRTTPLGEPFYPKGHILTGASGGRLALDYDDTFGPPLHPQCRCSVQSVLNVS